MTVFKQLLNDYKQCLLRGDHSDGAAAYLAIVAEHEQAARRAPAAPVPQGFELVQEAFLREFFYKSKTYLLNTQAPAHYWNQEDRDAYSDGYQKCGSEFAKLREYLAAAPQPPEAAPHALQTERGLIGENPASKPVAQGSVSNATLAAPVELPEPVYTMRVRGRMHDYTPTLSAFDLAHGEHKLYTEQQVRQLLSNHGIKANK